MREDEKDGEKKGRREKGERVCACTNLRRPQRKKGQYELPPGISEQQSVRLALSRIVRLERDEDVKSLNTTRCWNSYHDKRRPLHFSKSTNMPKNTRTKTIMIITN